MKRHHQSVVWASLAADGLALGAHWIYDTKQIDQQIGRMETLRAPLPTSFHTTKNRGELTHYGDQTLTLLKSLADNDGFSLETFADTWRQSFANYEGYRDHATKETLKNFGKGVHVSEVGSNSSDLGGAARIAPLVYRYQDDEAFMRTSVRQQTALTHRNTSVIDSAEYFARVAFAVMHGQKPLAALEEVFQEDFNRAPFDRWVTEGLGSRDQNTREVVAKFGQACDVDGAFPGVIHMIARYQDNPVEGLIENVMAGGDSAARGLIAGMIFGAYLGMAAVSEKWVSELEAHGTIENCLTVLG